MRNKVLVKETQNPLSQSNSGLDIERKHHTISASKFYHIPIIKEF